MPIENFGHLVGIPKTSWSSNDQWMIILENFVYIDKDNKHWTAPKGVEIDGASIPRVFWTLIGSPYTGKYRRAAIIHDAQCVLKVNKWYDVHKMFYEACRAGGVDDRMSKTLYYAVYHFGPRWIDDHGVLAAEPPSIEEVKKIHKLITEKNFTLETIRRL